MVVVVVSSSLPKPHVRSDTDGWDENGLIVQFDTDGGTSFSTIYV